MRSIFKRIFSCAALAFLFCSCGQKQSSPTPQGNAPVEQIFHLGNGTEPQDLDPHTVAGVPEHHIITALIEGLVVPEPHDPGHVKVLPGVAETWDISPDKTTYTFHLRANSKWSNGDPVTAQDFVKTYQRILSPTLASEYAYMLFIVKGAEDFNTSKLKNFDDVGFKALDDRTLQVQLRAPTPYFLPLLTHYSWFPLHLPTLEKYGKVYERGNTWTLPGHFVGNGPFLLTEWKQNQIIIVKKNPDYWDAANVKLKEIHFHPIESEDTEERAFRTGQLHVSNTVPGSKIPVYRKEHPDWLVIDDYFGNYFYRLNVTKPPLNNKKVRQALALCIDRKAIVEHITRAGQKPAYNLTPTIANLYQCEPQFAEDIEKARKLMAEAGYPGGKGCPTIEILFNTLETHRSIAEAIQQMWKKHLGIDAQLVNQEWKVYLDSQRQLNYQVCRGSWIGDYPDPNSFLDMWVTGGGNNETGFSNAEYDRLIREAGMTADPKARMEIFHKAEVLLMDEMPIIPIYFYTKNFLMKPNVKGWYSNILDDHPWKFVYLE